MKKILFFVIFIAAGIALYEQSKSRPNIYIKVVAVAVFMFGLMWISAKIPSRTSDKKTMMFKIGDRVSVLDEAVNGIVLSITNNEITIESDEGFTMTYLVNELIKNHNASDLDISKGSYNLHTAIKEKEVAKPNHFIKQKKQKTENAPPEFDLHIEKLTKNFRSMNNFDILTLQTETAKRHIEFAIKNRIPKIILIHGVGEGILKAELDFLFGRYENIAFHDANYQKYGTGATEIIIKQRK